MNVISLFILALTARSVIGVKYLDRCLVRTTNKNGICTSLPDCPKVKYELQDVHKMPQICGFIRNQALVCCPEEEIVYEMKKPNKPVQNLLQAEVPDIQENPVKFNQECSGDPKRITSKESSREFCNLQETISRIRQSIVNVGYEENGERVYGCSGIILNTNHVLITEKCTYYKNRYLATSVVPESSTKNFRVSQIQKITEPKEGAYTNNIALLKLIKSINEPSISTKPMCVRPLFNEERSIFIASWPNNKTNTITLEEAQIVATENCSLDKNSQEFFCVHQPNHILNNNAILFRIIGKDCVPVIDGILNYQASKKMLVFTRVRYHAPWIENLIWT